MPSQLEYKPVGDDVPRVDGEVAVGEDLPFQRRWWRFEKIVWSFFVLVLIADLSGILGRGPLANTVGHAPDGSLTVKYERVERANTPSIVTILPEAQDVHDGKLRLYVSDAVLKKLGAERVIPQPEVSEIGNGGVTYTFAATAMPMTVQIALQPSFIGEHHFTIAVSGAQPVNGGALVLP